MTTDDVYGNCTRQCFCLDSLPGLMVQPVYIQRQTDTEQELKASIDSSSDLRENPMVAIEAKAFQVDPIARLSRTCLETSRAWQCSS